MIFLAMYGNVVNFKEAIFISLFAMIIVFLVLLILSFMIDFTALIINKNKQKDVNQVKIIKDENKNKNENNNISDTSLVAIIAASIASMMNTDIDNIRITKIKRVGNTNSMWSEKGLLDNIN